MNLQLSSETLEPSDKGSGPNAIATGGSCMAVGSDQNTKIWQQLQRKMYQLMSHSMKRKMMVTALRCSGLMERIWGLARTALSPICNGSRPARGKVAENMKCSVQTEIELVEWPCEEWKVPLKTSKIWNACVRKSGLCKCSIEKSPLFELSKQPLATHVSMFFSNAMQHVHLEPKWYIFQIVKIP